VDLTQAAPKLRARSQLTTHKTLAQLAVAQNGDLVLSSPSYEPTTVVLPAPPFASAIAAVELDAADGFLVGADGLIVHVAARPWKRNPTTCLQ
jgi:hypothetical protein